MAAITLAQAQAKLDLWMAADDAVAGAQSYIIGTRSLTKANSEEIRENIKFWSTQVETLSRSGGGIRIRRTVVAHD